MAIVRELRVNYRLMSLNDNPVVHAVVCKPEEVEGYLDKIALYGYEPLHIDERFRDTDKVTPLDEGWKTRYCPVKLERSK